MIKFLHILSWIPIAIIKLILAIIGALFAVPLALVETRFIDLPVDANTYFTKKWWLWDNKEEGLPEWWLRKASNASGEKWHEKAIAWMIRTFPRWWWFAVRNPVNGFRWIFKEPEEVTVEGYGGQMEAMYLVRDNLVVAKRWTFGGPFAGYRKVWLTDPGKYSEIWFGWKVGSNIPGMGFTMQWRRNRKIGT
jgi:hypothetical protein